MPEILDKDTVAQTVFLAQRLSLHVSCFSPSVFFVLFCCFVLTFCDPHVQHVDLFQETCSDWFCFVCLFVVVFLSVSNTYTHTKTA